MDNPYFSSLQHVIDYMRNYFYLGGSRNKLQDFDITTNRDWDFQCPQFEFMNNYDQDWVRECFEKETPKPPVEVIRDSQGITWQIAEMVESEPYTDVLFAGLWKHKLYPQITLIERKDLELYRKVFEFMDTNYWKQFMWKSNPDQTFVLSKEARTKVFNDLYRVAGGYCG